MMLNRHLFMKLIELDKPNKHGINYTHIKTSSKDDEKYKSTWLKNSYRLSQVLVILLHLAGGPGSRMTEEAVWLVSNSLYSSASRNVRFALGSICVINTYSKSRQLTSGKPEDVASFACDDLSLMTLFFLIVVKHLELQFLEQPSLSNPNAHSNSRMYFICKKGVPIKGITLGYIFAKELSAYGIDLTISGFRQALDAFARTCPGVEEPWKVGLSNTLGLNANHSHMMHMSTYGRSTHDLPGFDADRIFLFKKCSTVWNELILGRRNPFEPKQKQLLNPPKLPRQKSPIRQDAPRYRIIESHTHVSTHTCTPFIM